MNVIRINSRNVIFVILALLSNTIKVAQMNYGGVANFGNNTSSSRNESNYNICPIGKECSKLEANCLICNLPDKNDPNCTYGSMYSTNCTAPLDVDCVGERTFMKEYMCRYCYQTDHWEHKCLQKNSCSSISSPPVYYLTECTVNSDIICLGNRIFPKNVRCNWTSGYKWSTALILSITLGGFGADRFYLGHWQEGIGKLFSFGGLGVWTLIDVILISMRYLGPADGSLYI